jgi:enolase
LCVSLSQGVPLYQHFADLAGVKAPFILPCPAFNVINGGSHAGNALAFQEFMILPVGAKDFEEAMQMGTETYHSKLLAREGKMRWAGAYDLFCG